MSAGQNRALFARWVRKQRGGFRFRDVEKWLSWRFPSPRYATVLLQERCAGGRLFRERRGRGKIRLDIGAQDSEGNPVGKGQSFRLTHPRYYAKRQHAARLRAKESRTMETLARHVLFRYAYVMMTDVIMPAHLELVNRTFSEISNGSQEETSWEPLRKPLRSELTQES